MQQLQDQPQKKVWNQDEKKSQDQVNNSKDSSVQRSQNEKQSNNKSMEIEFKQYNIDGQNQFENQEEKYNQFQERQQLEIIYTPDSNRQGQQQKNNYLSMQKQQTSTTFARGNSDKSLISIQQQQRCKKTYIQPEYESDNQSPPKQKQISNGQDQQEQVPLQNDPNEGDYYLKKTKTNCLSFSFIDIGNCRGHTYNISTTSSSLYEIQVQWKSFKQCVFGQFQIVVTENERSQQVQEQKLDEQQQQYNLWEISYCFCSNQWIMSNKERKDKIVYNHPYFIITDVVAWKQYKYIFKKPSFCRNAKLQDIDKNIIINFEPKVNEIRINSDKKYLKFLIPIVVFIDQQKLDIYI